MEQYFQYVAPKVLYNIFFDYFPAHFAKYFPQKLTPQQCCEIVSFKLLSKVNPIGLMKKWVKSSCTICMAGDIEIINHSKYIGILNTAQT